MTTAKIVPGEPYSDGNYRAIYQPDGSMLLAQAPDERRRYVTRAEATAAAGRRRWCPAARRMSGELIMDASIQARREVCTLLGVPQLRGHTFIVVLSCGEVCTPSGIVVARLQR